MKMIIKLLSSESGISSKRLITLLAFFLMGLGFISNLFFSFTIEEFIYETMSYIVIAGLGFTASEFFSKKNDKNKIEVENTERE